MKNTLIPLLFISSLALFICSCGDDFKQSNANGTTFSTSTPLSKTSFYNGIWLKQETLEQLENEPEALCQEQNGTSYLNWMEVDTQGLISFKTSENKQDKNLKNTARIDNEGNLKPKNKFKTMQKKQFKKEIEKCLEENLGSEKIYMSDQNFQQSFEKNEKSLVINYVHTSYHCQDSEQFYTDTLDATTINYQKLSKKELKELIKDYKGICK